MWGAVIGAALGIGQSVLGAASANDEAKKQAKKQQQAAQQQHDFAVREWEFANKQANLQWEWDMARTNQLRDVELQKAQDQANYANMLIHNAGQNLSINQAALADRFVTEEKLRGQQVGMEYAYGQGKLQSEYQYQSTQLAMDQLEQSRQFLNQINLLGNQSNSVLQRYQDDTTDLMASLTLDEARDTLGYHLQQIAAMEQDGRISAVTSAQQGGGATSQRLALSAAQAAGRTYAELDQKARSRDLKVAMANTTMRNSTNSEMTRFALQSQDQIARGDYAYGKAKRDQELLSSTYNRDTTYQANVLEKLTMPTFDLGQRQYGRELAALQIQTDAKLFEAAQPYRMAPFLDPLKPTPGLRPELATVGSPSKVGTAGLIGSALVNGLSTAETYNKAATGNSLFKNLG
jgi:hypothetical protein